MFRVAAAGRGGRERAGWPGMPAADEIQSLGGGRYYWQVYNPAVKTELMSTTLNAGDAWYFFDPVPLAPAALGEFSVKPGCRGAILLTNANHERAAREYRECFRLPIIAHPDAAQSLELSLDQTTADGEALFGQLVVVALPGAAVGEVAYFHAATRTLWVGDALIHAEPFGFAALPAKYCNDERRLHAALPRLLELDFDQIIFAHGTPILSGAHARLSELVASLR